MAFTIHPIAIYKKPMLLNPPQGRAENIARTAPPKMGLCIV